MTKPALVITGCEGYIGRVAIARLSSRYRIIGCDRKRNLNNLIHPDQFYFADFNSIPFLENIRMEHRNGTLAGIVHLAADSLIAPARVDPIRYYRNNVGASIEFVHYLIQNKIDVPFIFASSASVYGDRNWPVVDGIIHGLPYSETDSTNPQITYGRTKLIFEEFLKVAKDSYDFNSTSFRFFNVIGGVIDIYGGCSYISQDINQPHILPSLYRAWKEKKPFQLKDPKVVRDYIYVWDVINAIELQINKGQDDCHVFNISTGIGTTNLEFVKLVKQHVAGDINIEIVSRRENDPGYCVGNPEKAREHLEFDPLDRRLIEPIRLAWTAFEQQWNAGLRLEFLPNTHISYT